MAGYDSLWVPPKGNYIVVSFTSPSAIKHVDSDATDDALAVYESERMGIADDATA